MSITQVPTFILFVSFSSTFVLLPSSLPLNYHFFLLIYVYMPVVKVIWFSHLVSITVFVLEVLE